MERHDKINLIDGLESAIVKKDKAIRRWGTNKKVCTREEILYFETQEKL